VTVFVGQARTWEKKIKIGRKGKSGELGESRESLEGAGELNGEKDRGQSWGKAVKQAYVLGP